MFTKSANALRPNQGLGRIATCSLVSLAVLLSGCGSTESDGIELQPSITTQSAATDAPLPASIATAILSQTPVPPTFTPAPGSGSTMISDKDGMMLLYVSAGDFTMGAIYDHCGECGNDSPSYIDNQPEHSVTLDAFWIDQTEVTNQQYAMCVSDRDCVLPLSLKSPMRSSYYGDPQFDHYPVVYVEWHMAVAYCGWAGRRLPTEAEWEKAARGTDARAYPWGNEPPNDNLLNYNSPVRDTTEAGKYPGGASPYGALDMAGNVWEWTSSLILPYPYSSTDGREDPLLNEARALRGGSWYYQDGSVISIFRHGVLPVDFLVRSDIRSWSLPVYENMSIYGRQRYGFGTVGFRCGMSAVPEKNPRS